MNADKVFNILSLFILVMFVSACGVSPAASPEAQSAVESESIAEIIAQYREQIQQDMLSRHIPGLAIAVVDDQSVLWAEGFGYTEWDNRTPVTPSTRFSIQSISKSFTATAAMIAAQEGLVDLDAPITTYLPNFTVHSIFEEHPERMMTLRILLSHTAGFPHDPGYGGNYDGPYGAPPYSFEKHIASVSDTWLMFPVGTHYSYSNIGIDLAGYILQVRSGIPFIQYVKEKVLDPLGMDDSTLDYQKVRADATHAIGHIGFPLRPPVDFQLLPSGGMWTSAEDMARYLQFHINKGALEGSRLLREDLAETMYTPPNLPAQSAYGDTGYALGITVDNRNNTRHFQHGGGGFGFNASVVWYPDLKLGSVVLINSSQSDGYVVDLSEGVLDNIMMTDIPMYHERSIHRTQVAPAYPPDNKGEVLTTDGLQALIASKAITETTESEKAAVQLRRSASVGTYIMTAWGLPFDTIEIGESGGHLTWSYQGELMINSSTTLTEVQPGMYFSTQGNLIDLRGPTRIIDNIRMIKVNPQTRIFQIAFDALCGVVFISALLFLPVRVFLNRSGRNLGRKEAVTKPAKQVPMSGWLAWASFLAALTSLFGLICLVLIALIPALIYVPWPHPYVDLTWWQFALVSLPFASLLTAVGVVLLAVLAIRKSTRSRATHWFFLIVGLTLLAFNGVLVF